MNLKNKYSIEGTKIGEIRLRVNLYERGLFSDDESVKTEEFKEKIKTSLVNQFGDNSGVEVGCVEIDKIFNKFKTLKHK